MVKEYRLTIQAAGQNEEEAVESAIRMLNQGASFDEVAYLYDEADDVQQPENGENATGG